MVVKPDSLVKRRNQLSLLHGYQYQWPATKGIETGTFRVPPTPLNININGPQRRVSKRKSSCKAKPLSHQYQWPATKGIETSSSDRPPRSPHDNQYQWPATKGIETVQLNAVRYGAGVININGPQRRVSKPPPPTAMPVWNAKININGPQRRVSKLEALTQDEGGLRININGPQRRVSKHVDLDVPFVASFHQYQWPATKGIETFPIFTMETRRPDQYQWPATKGIETEIETTAPS